METQVRDSSPRLKPNDLSPRLSLIQSFWFKSSASATSAAKRLASRNKTSERNPGLLKLNAHMTIPVQPWIHVALRKTATTGMQKINVSRVDRPIKPTSVQLDVGIYSADGQIHLHTSELVSRPKACTRVAPISSGGSTGLSIRSQSSGTPSVNRQSHSWHSERACHSSRQAAVE